MNSLDFLESLKANNSILLKKECKDWKDAVQECFIPLLDKKIIKQSYIDGVIESTTQHGPYYIICPKLAMPHANPETGALGNGFSLMTLSKPVYFDDKPIYILIGFAANNNEVHLEIALPQIVAIFEDQKVIEEMIECNEVSQIEEIIKAIDYFKYIKK